MMACKARTFPDVNEIGSEESLLSRIMTCEDPAKIKAFGRQVSGYNEDIWKRERYGLVLRGIKAKFEQNPDLMKILLSTGEAILVEASPNDKIWGIGLSATDPNIHNPRKWRGTNLLGLALMETRSSAQEAR